jgi:hypothetical protein
MKAKRGDCRVRTTFIGIVGKNGFTRLLLLIPRVSRQTSSIPGQKSSSRKYKFTEIWNIVLGVFTPVLAKHTKSFNLVDTLSVGVDGFNGTSSRCSARARHGA